MSKTSWVGSNLFRPPVANMFAIGRAKGASVEAVPAHDSIIGRAAETRHASARVAFIGSDASRRAAERNS